MKLLIGTVAASFALALPAVAQDAAATDPATMTCADFMAMDEAGQRGAIEAMQVAVASGAAATDAGAEATGATESAEAATTATTEAEATETADAGTAGAETEVTDVEATAGTEAEADVTADAGAMADGTLADDVTIDAALEDMTAACEGNPDMMAMDALKEAEVN